MNLIFSSNYTNRIELAASHGSISSNEALLNIKAALIKLGAKKIELKNNWITFEAGLQRISVLNRGNLLNFISFGSIGVKSEKGNLVIEYHISFSEIRMVAIGVFLAIVFLILLNGDEESAYSSLILSVFAYIMIYIPSVLLGRYYFRGFIVSSIKLR